MAIAGRGDFGLNRRADFWLDGEVLPFRHEPAITLPTSSRAEPDPDLCGPRS
jgi:hypothetical protein